MFTQMATCLTRLVVRSIIHIELCEHSIVGHHNRVQEAGSKFVFRGSFLFFFFFFFFLVGGKGGKAE